MRAHFPHKNQKELYVIILDFKKAFDKCHIPTLLSKLDKKGIGGKLLKVIADMYTDAHASLQINDTLGQRFKVTRGVSQGCVLSPLFFDIYLDDLLERFRESGLGVPIHCLLLNAFGFADDLALIASDKETVSKLS